MNSVIVRARAKINWTLDIVGTDAKGYHLLDTLMQRITLFDKVTVTMADNISVICPDTDLPTDESNIAFRAAREYFCAAGINGGCEIRIAKHIPVGAGFAGGSADAAAVLFALEKLYQAHVDLPSTALRLGADVPFMLCDGLYRARGTGEKLEELPCRHTYHILGVMPEDMPACTKDVYSKYDQITTDSRPDNTAFIAALLSGETENMQSVGANVLYPAAKLLVPRVGELVAQMQSAGAVYTSMTGSGSAVFGVFSSLKDANAALEAFGRGLWRQVFSTSSDGLTIV